LSSSNFTTELTYNTNVHVNKWKGPRTMCSSEGPHHHQLNNWPNKETFHQFCRVVKLCLDMTSCFGDTTYFHVWPCKTWWPRNMLHSYRY
jgi:hypothetical protein